MATVTLKGSPQALTPGYNPNVWYFDSTNKALPGYRYVVKVYSVSTILLATYRFQPRPGDGYAVVDLTKLLKNFVSYDKDISVNPVDFIPNSYFGYYLEVYDEYNTVYTYGDFTFGAGNLTDLNGALTSTTHNFSVGDYIQVMQTDGGTEKPMLQGVHQVIAPTVTGTSDLYIEIPFSVVGSGVTMGGTVAYADNRKTISAVELTTSTVYIFNGAVKYLEFPTYNMADYVMGVPSNDSLFLTSMPRMNNNTNILDYSFSITPTQDVLLNFANNFTNYTIVHFVNSNGDEFEISYYTTGTTEPILRANVGPNTPSPSVITGSLPLVKPDTTWYNVQVLDATSGNPLSEQLVFNIDRRCQINDSEILFLDRMGSFNSLAFPLRITNTKNNTKSTYKKLSGDLGTGGDGNPAYNYSSIDRGENVYNVDYSQVATLNTDWIGQGMSEYMQELITSPVTYWKHDGAYEAVVIVDSTMVEQSQKDKHLVRYSIQVRNANNSNINI